ncbi:MAG: chloride channel protein, partial [Firmicutes bacterium]|nr:chloride channel protein [Bacillota bacterium]
NCPISSVFLSVEIFGSANFLLFGITCAITYLMSGYYSLYSGQKFMNSKTMPLSVDKAAK